MLPDFCDDGRKEVNTVSLSIETIQCVSLFFFGLYEGRNSIIEENINVFDVPIVFQVNRELFYVFHLSSW